MSIYYYPYFEIILLFGFLIFILLIALLYNAWKLNGDNKAIKENSDSWGVLIKLSIILLITLPLFVFLYYPYAITFGIIALFLLFFSKGKIMDSKIVSEHKKKDKIPNYMKELGPKEMKYEHGDYVSSNSQRFCERCNTKLSEKSLFCHECGKPIHSKVRFCQFCGVHLKENGVFCHRCGNLINNPVLPKAIEKQESKNQHVNKRNESRANTKSFCTFCGNEI